MSMCRWRRRGPAASTAPVCTQVSRSRRLRQLHERVVVLQAAAAPALVEVARERRAAHVHADRRALADRRRSAPGCAPRAGTSKAPSPPAPSRSRDRSARARRRRACRRPRGASRAGSCSTSVPISSRIRIACSWMVSICSSVRTFGAFSRSNIGSSPPSAGSSRSSSGPMPRSWISSGCSMYSAISRALASRSGSGCWRTNRIRRDVVEVGLLQPREPVEPEAADDRAVPVRDEPVGEEVDADVVGEPLVQVAGVPLEAVHAGGTHGRVPREDLVEAPAGAAVAVHHDDALVARREDPSASPPPPARCRAASCAGRSRCRGRRRPSRACSRGTRCPARRRRTR